MGIAVALLGANKPAGVAAAALLMAALWQGGMSVDMYSDRVSRDVVYVIQGLVVVAVAVGQAIAARGTRRV